MPLARGLQWSVWLDEHLPLRLKLAGATQHFNADGTAAGDLERKVITISELATSAEQWLLTLGRGRCASSAEGKALKQHPSAGL